MPPPDAEELQLDFAEVSGRAERWLARWEALTPIILTPLKPV
jgi:hypothetical protein